MAVPKLKINNKLLAIYEYLNRDYERRVLNDCSVAKRIFQKLKRNIVKYFRFKNYSYKSIMLGGPSVFKSMKLLFIKVLLLSLPLVYMIICQELTWLVGFITEHTGRIYIEIVEDRTSNTLTKLIREHVYVDTLIITDGYPSYPKAIHDSFCMHEIVNHRLGFKNTNEFSINNIENIWSLLR